MRMTIAWRRRAGFTLIELLVVVVIIGILASIALPNFLGAQDRARNASVAGNIHAVNLALGQYAADNNGSYPAPTTNLADAGGGGGDNGHGHGHGGGHGGGGTGTTAAGLGGLESYLPGGKLPASPWGGLPQTSFVPTAGTSGGGGQGHGHDQSISLADARAIAENGQTLTAIGADLGAGSVPSAEPAALTDYGAISYSYDEGAQTYVLYGSGKKSSRAIVSGAASNGGQ